MPAGSGKPEHVLAGKRVLITAGPTIEMWDSFRYLSNLSTGLMGSELAKAAACLGGLPELVANADVGCPPCAIRHNVVSAEDMLEAVKKNITEADIFISAAAVCDFRPVRLNTKIRKRDGLPVMRLERTPDVLKWAGTNPGQCLIVGFSLSDELDIDMAYSKMQEKKCYIIVANEIVHAGSTQRRIAILTEKARWYHTLPGRKEIAEVIIKKCAEMTTS